MNVYEEIIFLAIWILVMLAFFSVIIWRIWCYIKLRSFYYYEQRCEDVDQVYRRYKINCHTKKEKRYYKDDFWQKEDNNYFTWSDYWKHKNAYFSD